MKRLFCENKVLVVSLSVLSPDMNNFSDKTERRFSSFLSIPWKIGYDAML